MKKAPKLMDSIQIGLIVAFGIFQIGQFIYNNLENVFVLAHYEEFEAGTIQIPDNLAIPYTIFFFSSIACILWIVVRFITYKKRKEEYLLEQE